MRFEKEPKIDRRTKQQVGWRYRFWVYNPNSQKNERVPVGQLPAGGNDFKTDVDAQAYCDIKSAEEHAVRVRLLKRQEWMSKFYDFQKELDAFAVVHRIGAKNSWKTDVDWLKNYVFPFFLNEKKANNVNNWQDHFQAFKTWLVEVKPLKGRRDRLAYNSINKAIKALNRFLSIMASQGKCQELAKCPVFPKEKCNRRTAEDCWEETEIQQTYEALKQIRPISAELFIVLARTGLRENEGLGLCVPFIKLGKIDGKRSAKIHEALAGYGLDQYFGYICLESQPALASIRDSAGRVPRRPLKHRKEISPKWFRYIPIADKEAWNILVRRWKRVVAELDSRKRGDEERDYLLFDGLTYPMFYSDVAKAFKKTKLRYRSPHTLRHSFLTEFYDATFSNPFLAEAVAGHRDKVIMENYSHAAEQRGLEQRGVRQQRDLMQEVS